MNIVKAIKNTALIAAFGLVSLNLFAASEDVPGADPIDTSGLSFEQIMCISNAYYQANFDNMDPDAFAALAEECGLPIPEVPID